MPCRHGTSSSPNACVVIVCVHMCQCTLISSHGVQISLQVSFWYACMCICACMLVYVCCASCCAGRDKGGSRGVGANQMQRCDVGGLGSVCSNQEPPPHPITSRRRRRRQRDRIWQRDENSNEGIELKSRCESTAREQCRKREELCN